LIFTYKGTKNISLLQLFGHFSYIELTLKIIIRSINTINDNTTLIYLAN